MSAMRWFSLDDVFPNTYQPRTSEDPEHIRKLADSILRDGLLQIPVGRLLNLSDLSDKVELAFGHSRLAAYKHLAETTNSYKKIPVEIRELDDQQMFELAIAENVARKDLTPIEEARAMQRYRDQFGKNSVEIGALFGISDSAVRNKLRLLELPEAAQESLKAGQIGEGSARRLLTLNRVRPEKVAEVVQTAVEKELTPQEIEKEVAQTLDRDPSMKLMWPSWQKNKTPLGGDGLWPLDWKPEKSGKSCTACEHYIRMDDNHYCANPDGWKQRKNEWMNAELIRLRDELGIPVYDRKADGKTFVEYIAWKNRDQFLAWFRERDAGLRLRINYSPYQTNRLTDSHCVDMISVDPAEVAKIEKEKTREKSLEADSFEARRQRRERSERFIEVVAAPCFAVQMGTPMDGPLPGLTKVALEEVSYYLTEKHETLPEDPRALRDLYRKLVALNLILDELAPYRTQELGPVAVAAELKGYLEAWGIAVPEDWEEKARLFEEGEE